MPILRIIDGFGTGFSLKLSDGRITIGRGGENEVQIGDPKASRVHAELTYQEDGNYLLKDLDSSNGTWGHEGAIDEITLHDGGTFRIGRTYMRLENEKSIFRGTLIGDTGEWREPGNIQRLIPSESQLMRRNGGNTSLMQANAYLVLLHQIVLGSQKLTDRESLFELIDDVAADALEGDRCAIFLPTPDGWALWPPHQQRLKARFGATPFADSFLQVVRSQRQALLCTMDGDIDPSQTMMQSGVRAAMAAPIQVGEDLHALLYVDRLRGREPYKRQDLEFLDAVANQIAIRIHNVEQVADLSAEVERLSARPRAATPDLIGRDSKVEEIRELIAKVAPTDAPVLISGESGTGKELIAQAIHAHSNRNDGPLHVVNCAAMAESLVDSTLFGHVKGAFTGANQDRPGLFELADGGTLFLDELGELPAPIQAKLLRTLEQGEVQRVGENYVRKIDVRFIAATNRDLPAEVEAGNFREDLWHRLNVFEITLPALRERPTDLDILIDHFLTKAAQKLDQTKAKISPEARALLLAYDWPGNVRQLRNAMDKAMILADNGLIRPEDLPQSVRQAEGSTEAAAATGDGIDHLPLLSLSEIERLHVLRMLDHTGGNKKATAELLGIDRSTLYAKLRQYKVH